MNDSMAKACADELEPQGLGWATAGLVCVHVLGVLALLGMIYVVAGGEIGSWYRAGGAQMLTMVLVGVVAVGGGLALAVSHVRRPRSVFSHVALPLSVVALGLICSVVAVSTAFDVSAGVSADLRVASWAAGVAAAEPCRQLSLLLAAFVFAMFPAVALATVATRVAACDETPSVEALSSTAIIAVIFLGLGVVLALHQGGELLDTWHLGMLLAAALIALAPGVAGMPLFIALGRSASPPARALAWESLWLATLGAIGLLLLIAKAMDVSRQAEALTLLATALPAAIQEHFSALARVSAAMEPALMAFMAAALTLATLATARSLEAFGAWARKYGALALGTVLCASLVIAASFALDRDIRLRSERVVDALWPTLPEDTVRSLPNFGEVPAPRARLATVVMHGGGLRMGKDVGGRLSEEQVEARLAEMLRQEVSTSGSGAKSAPLASAAVLLAAPGQQVAATVHELATRLGENAGTAVQLVALPPTVSAGFAFEPVIERLSPGIARHLFLRLERRPRILRVRPVPAADAAGAEPVPAAVIHVGRSDVVLTVEGRVAVAVQREPVPEAMQSLAVPSRSLAVGGELPRQREVAALAESLRAAVVGVPSGAIALQHAADTPYQVLVDALSALYEASPSESPIAWLAASATPTTSPAAAATGHP